MDQRFHLLADIGDFGIGEGHEPPVLRPGIVKDIEDDRCIAIEMRELHLADGDPRLALPRLDDALYDRWKFAGNTNFICQQRFGMRVIERLHPSFVIRRIVPHHYCGRMIVSPHQQTGFLPYRQRQGRKDASHALIAQPLFRRRYQRGCHGLVGSFHQAPIACTRTHSLFGRLTFGEMIDMRGYPADDLFTTPRDEQLHGRMSEKGVASRIDQLRHFGSQGRHPCGIPFVQAIGDVDECFAIALSAATRGNGCNIDSCFVLHIRYDFRSRSGGFRLLCAYLSVSTRSQRRWPISGDA